MTVLPSADSETARPCWEAPTDPLPTSLLPCWVQIPPLRVKTHAAPTKPLSAYPPTMAVLPSADSETDLPCSAAPVAPKPTSFPPCWVHLPPLRVKNHVAPAYPLSPDPPITAVFPSADKATAWP